MSALAIEVRHAAALEYAETCAQLARESFDEDSRAWWLEEELGARAATLALEGGVV
jgi:hypothetical protein